MFTSELIFPNIIAKSIIVDAQLLQDINICSVCNYKYENNNYIVYTIVPTKHIKRILTKKMTTTSL